MSNRSPTVAYKLLAVLTWHQFVVVFFPPVWNQAAEGPPCSAGFGPGCREGGCTAGPTRAEQTEQQEVQGGGHWRLGRWSHREHHWAATCTRWVHRWSSTVGSHWTAALLQGSIASLQAAVSHCCREAASALKWQELLYLGAGSKQSQRNDRGRKWLRCTFPVSSWLDPSNTREAAAKWKLAKG